MELISRNSTAVERNIQVAMIAAPITQLIADALWFGNDMVLVGTILRQISYLLFIPAVLGIGLLSSSRSIGMIAMWLCWLGIAGGIAIVTMFRLGLGSGMGESGIPVIAEQAFAYHPAVGISIFIPGILFPLGHVLFGFAFLKRDTHKYLVSLLFLVPGVLFWMGNALEIKAALYAADILMIAGYFLLAQSSTSYQSVSDFIRRR